ncbi:hypothetical protein GGD56_002240 [Rhizobium mongolense]|uniref:Uncharacterized protein n=1 Tax=Rhizobium mongolense TaxID=57676 RepID=A0ABR6IKL6_9HYPH|nr:hypothetical protein [Rhizobium mongolense]
MAGCGADCAASCGGMEATRYASDTTDAARPDRATGTGLGRQRPWPWWNAGASHMNDAFRKAFFDQLGLISLQQELRRLNHAS